jgi:ABC-2 type transport system permease protein
MKKYIRIYKMLITLNLARILEYRMNFINSTISTVGWGIFSLLVMVLLTSKTKSVLGWSQTELLILAGCVNIFFGIFRSIFSGNFETLGTSVKLGRLDGILLKPIDSQFTLSFTYLNPTGLFRIIIGFFFVAYLFYVHHLPISFEQIFLFLILLIVGMILLYSFCYSVLTLTIWFPDLTNIIGLIYALDSVVRYPQEIYRKMGLFFIFIVPLTFVVIPAVKVLLHKATIFDVIAQVIIAGILFVLSRLLWQFALRFYTSASS